MKIVAFTAILVLLSNFLFARSVYRVEGNDVIIELDSYGVKSKIMVVEMWSTSAARIVTTTNDNISQTECIMAERNVAPVKFKAIYVQNDVEISTSEMIITVKENGLVSLLNRDGRKMMIESDRSFEPSATDENAYKVTQKFFMNRKELLYGFGHDGLNSRYNIRNQNFTMEHSNTATFSPVCFSESGFAFIWNNYSKTHYDEKSTVMTLTSDVADDISYFFIYKDSWEALIAEIRSIFGSALLLPQWAYGFHLNPDAYSSDSELLQAIEKYKSMGIAVEDQTTDNTYLTKEKKITTTNTEPKFQNVLAFKTLLPEYKSIIDESTETRHVVTSHSNLPGIQRYGLISVAGEVESSWKALKAQVSAAITSSFTGQLHWSTTLGGATLSSSLPAADRNELLTRWYQFAAFTPVFQGGINTELWSLGSSESVNYKAASNSIQIRYQLLPYIYSTAYDAVAKNKAMIKSLVFVAPNDPKILTIDQQYLFGQSLMVCPVTQAGAKSIKVQLPANVAWYNFWTGQKTDGGITVDQKVSIENIPVFVKEGSIVPMITSQPDTAQNNLQAIEIRVYTGADASFVYYEDGGDGMGYKTEHFTKITFDYTEKNKTLTISSPEGSHHGSTIEKMFRVVNVTENNGVGGSEAAEYQELHYKGKRTKVKL
ncbi:MAG TPA: glycoside hydrolase family 31 protein [Prolixibacteraceae bacterium]|nr:glycoside hydrolase family 31 protein [Prolixibacteraceae bacterium]